MKKSSKNPVPPPEPVVIPPCPPIRVGWFSDPHLGIPQYGNPQREEDFFLGLKEALRVLVEEQKVEVLICSGDMFHAARLTSRTHNRFMELNHYLVVNEVCCYVIEGNHDLAVPPWPPQGSGPGFFLLQGMVKDDTTDLKIAGCGYRSTELLKSWLSELPPGNDLLVLHQPVQEFVSFPLPHALSLRDISGTLAQLVCLGDIHRRRFIPLPDDSGVEAGYPGSTEACYSDEDIQKTVEVIEFDRESFKLLGHHPVDIRTRPVLRVEIANEEEFQAELALLEIWTPVDSVRDSRYPLLHLRHAPEIGRVREILETRLGHNPWIFRISLITEGGTADCQEDAMVLQADPAAAILDVQQLLEELIPADHPLHPLASRLCQREADVTLVLSDWQQDLNLRPGS